MGTNLEPRDRDDAARPSPRPPGGTPALVGRPRLRACPFLSPAPRRGGRSPGGHPDLDDLPNSPSPPRPTCATTTPSVSSRYRRREIARVHASSGTRGKLTVVGYTRHDLAVWARSRRPRRSASPVAEPGDIIHNAYGYGLFTGGLGLHYGAETLGATVVPMGGGNTPRQVMLIRDFAARGLCCTPSYALTIAEECERQGSTRRRSRSPTASSARSPGRTRCATRSSGVWTSSPPTSTASAKSSARASPTSAPRCSTASTSPRTTSYPRSSTPETGEVLPPASGANSSSPR